MSTHAKYNIEVEEAKVKVDLSIYSRADLLTALEEFGINIPGSRSGASEINVAQLVALVDSDRATTADLYADLERKESKTVPTSTDTMALKNICNSFTLKPMRLDIDYSKAENSENFSIDLSFFKKPSTTAVATPLATKVSPSVNINKDGKHIADNEDKTLTIPMMGGVIKYPEGLVPNLDQEHVRFASDLAADVSIEDGSVRVNASTEVSALFKKYHHNAQRTAARDIVVKIINQMFEGLTKPAGYKCKGYALVDLLNSELSKYPTEIVDNWMVDYYGKNPPLGKPTITMKAFRTVVQNGKKTKNPVVIPYGLGPKTPVPSKISDEIFLMTVKAYSTSFGAKDRDRGVRVADAYYGNPANTTLLKHMKWISVIRTLKAEYSVIYTDLTNPNDAMAVACNTDRVIGYKQGSNQNDKQIVASIESARKLPEIASRVFSYVKPIRVDGCIYVSLNKHEPVAYSSETSKTLAISVLAWTNWRDSNVIDSSIPRVGLFDPTIAVESCFGPTDEGEKDQKYISAALTFHENVVPMSNVNVFKNIMTSDIFKQMYVTFMLNAHSYRYHRIPVTSIFRDMPWKNATKQLEAFDYSFITEEKLSLGSLTMESKDWDALSAGIIDELNAVLMEEAKHKYAITEIPAEYVSPPSSEVVELKEEYAPPKEVKTIAPTAVRKQGAKKGLVVRTGRARDGEPQQAKQSATTPQPEIGDESERLLAAYFQEK